ncbi:MarR family winged helix-turn-helix transcriptional regulator [Leifsonia poae]|uniref:MarR family winged helix-turn-helix transcriptional regulator n=1 Tax=Leifsonia poae TaxID=110933 RepID=UPI001CBAAF9C|nr:MarR family transcriptional regulator [Leifsonia poae]
MTSSRAAAVRAVDAALSAANVMMRVAARSVFEVEDRVTTPQLRVLMMIAATGPQNLGAVATELGVHPSNATRACEKLVRAGYIVRSDHPADRRYIRLELTETGNDLVNHVLDRRRSSMAQVLQSLPETDQMRIADAFEIFARAAGGEAIHDGRFAFSLNP